MRLNAKPDLEKTLWQAGCAIHAQREDVEHTLKQ